MPAELGHRGRSAQPRRPQRRLGAFCVRCGVKEALPNRRYPHLATNWCSDQCREADKRAAKSPRRHRAAEQIRVLMGLPTGRGPDFTAPELEMMEQRLRRVLPYAGGAMGRRGPGRPPGSVRRLLGDP